jgi:hypothetical protein
MTKFKSIYSGKKFYPSTNIVNDLNDRENNYAISSKISHSYSIIRDSYYSSAINRAFSITGPYGTGKSSFVKYVVNSLAEEVSGYDLKTISIVSDYEPFLKTVERGFIEFEKKSKIRFLRKIQDRDVSPSDILDAISYYNKKFNILIAIDEFGKNLEYESINNGSKNLHLLQNIAELTSRLKENKIVFITVQHQSIATYFSTNENKIKQDWAKVQGRFTELNILEDNQQLANNICEYISSKSNSHTKEITSTFNKITPKNLNLNGLNFEKAYPLHPLSVLTLPALSLSLGQNGRTIYTYINHRGEGSIYERLNSKISIENLLDLTNLYDYFNSVISNQVSTSSSAKIWSELTNKINSYQGDEHSIKLLKVIGILNVTNPAVKIKASKDNILLALSVDIKSAIGKEYLKKLKKLEMEGFIIYRGFAKEFRVWEGSDIDIDKKIIAEKNIISISSVSEMLNKLNNKKIIVASRNTYETGFYRYFDVKFIDKLNLSSICKSDSASGVLGLALEQDIEKEIKKMCPSYNLLVKPKMNVENLRRLGLELVATKNVYAWLQENEIRDKVARAELENRIDVLSSEFNTELNKYIYNVHNIKSWHFYRAGQVTVLENASSVNSVISNALKETYPKSPTGVVEHLSRDAITQQAANGRLTLLKGILNKTSEPNLGFSGDGPEVALYRNILSRNNLHKQKNKVYVLDRPNKNNNLWSVWAYIESMLRSESKLTVQEMVDNCNVEPYGLKESYGLTLVCIVILKNISKISFYEDDRYQVEFTESHLERLLRNPKKFKVKMIDNKSSELSLLNEYVNAFGLPSLENNSENLLRLTTLLIKAVRSLPEYTQESGNNTPSQKALLVAVKNAVDPVELFTKTIPSIYPQFNITNQVGMANIALSAKLDINLLSNRYQEMLDSVEKEICASRGTVNVYDLTKRYKESAGLLFESTSDTNLKVFLGSFLREFINKYDWLESICLAITGKVPKSWHGEDRNEFSLNLNKMIKQWINLETLNISYMGSGGHIITITNIENGEYLLPVIITEEDTETSMEIYQELTRKYSENTIKAISGSLVKVLLQHTINNVSTVDTRVKGDDRG